ncbi:unnamed protein product [Aspergillus oryzae RIB40]|uniref:tRNA(Phe) 7-[(3-amino-3-carboxypropyl)-4-demethylwyosine(37)-N(4)]-methyltransferase n=1 Tax=Aspergillus oryzae (strain ATCC 42149 / RIB 40) TaxID=510516 RepID=Q2U6S0_ASPOR|nr:unnamed protein product [Aspergillus oryzae RIB40]BAE62745.1 unnamed protein product [Aspergillus oryzae RIB40]
MAATLQHAHPVLSAASSSGFRESGLQSLRCLEGDEGPSPIVAVRSAGLSLESVIGYCEDSDADDETATGEPGIRSLVTEEYLQITKRKIPGEFAGFMLCESRTKDEQED